MSTPASGGDIVWGSGLPAQSGGGSMGWIGPAIGGAASLGGAAIGSKGANKAAEAQAKAAADALAFQKAEAEKKWAFDQKRWDAWNAGRAELMKRYGIDIAPPSISGAGAGPAGAGGAAVAAGPRLGGQPGVPQNLRAMMAAGQAGEAPELGSWSDWRSYGLRGGQEA